MSPRRAPGQDRAQRGWRQALEEDPLGIATRRRYEDADGDQAATSAAGPANQRAALLKLVVAVGAIIAAGYAAGVGETVLLVGALLVCILLHELGHYLAARSGGIKVTEFFVGFGPKLWAVRRGETEYGVKALPLGGYCRILGMNNLEEVDPKDEPRTYRQAPVLRRLAVASAGSAAHFLIALVVLFAMFFWTGDDGNYVTSAAALPASAPIVQIDGLAHGQSPAQKAGFRIGDRIVAVDGRRFSNWQQLTDFVDARPGRRLDMTVLRDGRLLHLYPVPVSRSDHRLEGGSALPAGKGEPAAFIGIAPSPIVHSSLGASCSRAGGAFVHVSALTLDAFGRLVTLHGIASYVHLLTSQKAASAPGSQSVRFVSPVGVVRILHQASQSGLPNVLWVLAVINISIGLFNLIPLLPLDGGHVAIALYEGARSTRRRRYHADVSKLLPLVYLALAAIIFIGLSSLFLDLRGLVA